MFCNGVNLGGWLVLEKWMNPGLFSSIASEACDEKSLMKKGGDRARRKVKEFRDSFIQEHDFEWLRDIGKVDAVRLPVGWWCLDEHAHGTPFLPTCEYVDKVFEWSRKYGIKVLLQYHGLSGSQNNDQNCGDGGRGIHWLEKDHLEMNLRVLEAFSRRWGREPSLIGLGLANEPRLTDEGARKCIALGCKWEWQPSHDFYVEASKLCRPHMREDVAFVIDSCWDIRRWAYGKLDKVQGPIWLDWHHYVVFGDPDKPGSVHEHKKAAHLRSLLKQSPFPVILGEYSLSMKQEAKGYRSGNWQQYFAEQQMGIAKKYSAGCFFWSYKMCVDNHPHWSYRESVELGWIDINNGIDEELADRRAQCCPLSHAFTGLRTNVVDNIRAHFLKSTYT
eukprot:TRINITY_DN5468_c0_g1_i1.p1 TRINITY_DN5468_c0_g1~~TRINITY_DN5468_c0_g1_i1.p1  ORF type:complete len:390 (-),score=19.90 TRINITY_DN5468_c0_g1_i1:430-1599(-)